MEVKENCFLGKLFSRKINSKYVLKEIINSFNHVSGCTIIKEDLIAEMLDFVMSIKTLVIKLYFLNDGSEHSKRVKNLLKKKTFSNIFDKLHILKQYRSKILKLFPSMQYFCALSTLFVLTKDFSTGSTEHVDNIMIGFTKFTVYEFLEVSVVVPVLTQYLSKYGFSISEMNKKVDEINNELE